MIVVTGGAGFIGSCLIKKLNNEGVSNIIVVDNLGKSDKWRNLNGKKFDSYYDKVEFIEEFIPDIDAFEEDSEIDAIVHLGACSDTTESDASYLMKNNYTYSKKLAEFAFDNDIRFIYASSAATYGDGSNGYSDKVFDDLKPLNCYGFSKHAFDLWILENDFHKDCVGLKFFNVFGPNEYHKGSMVSMVYQAYHQIKETGKVKLFKSQNPDYKDGEQMRDFVYVKDCVDIIFEMLVNPKINGIYNIGTGTAHSWNQLAQAAFSSMKKHQIIEYIDMPDNLVNQYQYFTEADVTKLMKKLPDFQFRTLEESVDDYIRNFLMSDDIYL